MAVNEPVTTANIRPGLFFSREHCWLSNNSIIAILTLLILFGFWLRATHLGAEGLSEDEWKKLVAVEDYRAHGLTSANGEHPMLMKELIRISLTLSEYWNRLPVANTSSLSIPTEAALRLPLTIFGAFTALAIFFLAAELFGKEIGLIAAALWTFDPAAIGFNRIAKEDSLMLFFFLLANIFWLRSQRKAETGQGNYLRYIWASGAAYGAMFASKYMLHYIGISASYYGTFLGLPSRKWELGKRRWLIFFLIMGATFLLLNPTILLPETWRAMKAFALADNRIGYQVISSYEYLGTLYPSKMTLWLKGLPWHFYYVFMAVKLPILTLVGLLLGLRLLPSRRLGDGRYFIFFWLFFWFFPFTVMGGKFTRYFTMALPPVLITAAIGIHWLAGRLSALLSEKSAISSATKSAVYAVIVLSFIAAPALASLSVTPYYRLYTNALGGGLEQAGNYFPHDEFFDGRLRESIAYIAAHAERGTRVASETPTLVDYYARVYGRDDLVSVWLSERDATQQLRAGDYVIVARGRRYLSNDAILARLQASGAPESTIMLGWTPAVGIYRLNETSLAAISDASKDRQ